MSDEWFQWQIAPDGKVEDGCHVLEAKALQDYFNNKSTPEEAAFAITRPLSKDPNWLTKKGSFWSLLIDALLDLDFTKRRQTITLLKAIEKLPPVEIATGDGTWYPIGFGAQWNDIVWLKQNWRELLNDAAYDAATREETRKRYKKAAALEAEMVESKVEDIDITYGLVCIADALESSKAILDIELPAVYEWVTIAGESLEAAMHSGVKIWQWTAPRDLYETNAKNGFGAPLDQARVAFWINRLRTIATGNDDVDPKIREGAVASAEIINKWIGAVR